MSFEEKIDVTALFIFYSNKDLILSSGRVACLITVTTGTNAPTNHGAWLSARFIHTAHTAVVITTTTKQNKNSRCMSAQTIT